MKFLDENLELNAFVSDVVLYENEVSCTLPKLLITPFKRKSNGNADDGNKEKKKAD